MDHIVKKLSEIEHAAEAVVEHAELEKSELEDKNVLFQKDDKNGYIGKMFDRILKFHNS